jgi:hypothetical protein
MSRQLCYWTSLIATILPALLLGTAGAQNVSKPALSQYEEQVLHDRLFQTNLRGPRWSAYLFFLSLPGLSLCSIFRLISIFVWQLVMKTNVF